ncbi:MAG: hypothetical protein ACLUE1_03515 [Adlercreutzia equolifaciens]
MAAKFWAAFLLAAVFTLMACALASLAMLAITDGDGDMVSVVLSLLGGWSALTGNGGVVSSIMGVANALVSAAYTVGLAFLSLTLGAWWARRHKVAAAVALYVELAGDLFCSLLSAFWPWWGTRERRRLCSAWCPSCRRW